MPPSLTPWWKIGTTGTRQWSWLLHGGSLGSPIWKDMEPHGSLGLSFQFCPSLTPFWHLAREPARLESTCPRPKCTDTWLSSLTDLNTISSLPERSKTSLQCAQLPWNSIHAKQWLFSFFLFFFLGYFLNLFFHWTSQVALVVKNSPANAGDIRDMGSIPEWGRSPGRGHGNLFQYSCLENPMDREVWQAKIHMVAQSQT